jgi:hypothetical protein
MVWDGDDLDCLQWKEETFDTTIRKFTMAQKIDQKYHKPEQEILLPPEYKDYASVFEKKASEHFPDRRPWDHAIELCDNLMDQRTTLTSFSIPCVIVYSLADTSVIHYLNVVDTGSLPPAH